MELMGLCNICGKPKAMYTCVLCGKLVCSSCYKSGKHVCINCENGKK